MKAQSFIKDYHSVTRMESPFSSGPWLLYFNLIFIIIKFSCAVFGVRNLMGRSGPEDLALVPVNSRLEVDLDCSKKNYSCKYCGKNYWNKTDCEGHINTHHLNLKPYVCRVCSVPFCYKQSLKRHELTCLVRNISQWFYRMVIFFEHGINDVFVMWVQHAGSTAWKFMTVQLFIAWIHKIYEK